MNILELNEKLLSLIKEFIEENEIEENEIELDTRLIGTSSIFDSMELVSFIVEVEQLLEEEYEIEIELATEKAMSRRTSPFISIRTFSEYIKELVDE